MDYGREDSNGWFWWEIDSVDWGGDGTSSGVLEFKKE